MHIKKKKKPLILVLLECEVFQLEFIKLRVVGLFSKNIDKVLNISKPALTSTVSICYILRSKYNFIHI